MTHRRALTVAGSDVSGGAGLAADLKMFNEYGVFGASVITCIVTFDPAEGFDHTIDFTTPESVIRQFDSTLGIHRFHAVKSGMLGSVDTAPMLAQRLRDIDAPYVFDPVLTYKGTGKGVIDLSQMMLETYVPAASVMTPNLDEAAKLVGSDSLDSVDDMTAAAKQLHALGAASVVVKGGARFPGPDAVDVFYDGSEVHVLRSRKVNDELVNGAGCSFASSIAAGLALGHRALDAVVSAKVKVAHGIARSMPNAMGVNSMFHPAARVWPHPDVSVTVS